MQAFCFGIVPAALPAILPNLPRPAACSMFPCAARLPASAGKLGFALPTAPSSAIEQSGQCALPIKWQVMKPFLKWAGGKYRVLPHILAALPDGKRLIEPFVGSGALFLNTGFKKYQLADANVDLINLYRHLQAEGESFIRYSQSLFVPENNNEEAFYRLRAEFNATADSRRKSALFVYLNRHCFNGLCRYNGKGEYNVPFGRYKAPAFPVKEMAAFHDKARHATFEVADFRTTMERARRGDVVYCDPPYVPLTATSNFTAYAAGGFGMEEQQALADMAEKLRKRGVTVLISNHDTDFTNAAYASAKIFTFDVKRFISADSANRNAAAELLAVFS